MAEYPFTLKGNQESFSGSGREDGETINTRDFSLSQGIVIAEIEHYGSGDFKVEFVPSEGIGKGGATAASLGGAFAAGAATGAVVGSIVPVAGTILGGILGGAVGWLTGGAIGDAIGPTIWTPVEYKGEIATFGVVRVKEEDEGCLSPGEYRLEVASQGKWTCRFIQPDLGQPMGPFTDDPDEVEDEEDGYAEAGLFVIGPFASGRKPLLANVHHRGGGHFFIVAYAVDGTHHCVVYEQEGQSLAEDVQTEIKPGKEYMLYIGADGDWNITFNEGY